MSLKYGTGYTIVHKTISLSNCKNIVMLLLFVADLRQLHWLLWRSYYVWFMRFHLLRHFFAIQLSGKLRCSLFMCMVHHNLPSFKVVSVLFLTHVNAAPYGGAHTSQCSWVIATDTSCSATVLRGRLSYTADFNDALHCTYRPATCVLTKNI
jgi:hypothetical protein